MALPLLEGTVVDARDDYDHLRRENTRLERENGDLRVRITKIENDNRMLERGMVNLRKFLTPLYQSLRMCFGEFDSAGVEGIAEGPTTTQPPQQSTRWESYKNNFPGAPARVVDALLAQREMTITQLAAYLKMHYDTAKAAVAKLAKAGAVTRDAGSGLVRLTSS